MDLIETLRTVTEGKIYVENERARVTRTLADIHEKDDELEKAAKVLQELQVGNIAIVLSVFGFFNGDILDNVCPALNPGLSL